VGVIERFERVVGSQVVHGGRVDGGQREDPMLVVQRLDDVGDIEAGGIVLLTRTTNGLGSGEHGCPSREGFWVAHPMLAQADPSGGSAQEECRGRAYERSVGIGSRSASTQAAEQAIARRLFLLAVCGPRHPTAVGGDPLEDIAEKLSLIVLESAELFDVVLIPGGVEGCP